MSSLQSIMQSGQLEPYIRYIRFPYFKNLQPGTKIDFTYPITALVGTNGTNKSSAIRALYGCPGYQNLGELWFSTVVDPILEAGGEGRNRFIYGYYNDSAKDVVEIIKTRIRKEQDPNYWEPSRPLISDGMNKMPPWTEGSKGRSKTRWETLPKDVIFIDFRQALSAFDKAFYHYDDTKKYSKSSRKDWIRHRISPLRKVIDGAQNAGTYYGKSRLSDDRLLDAGTVADISKIIGRNYASIRLIRHSFLGPNATTCLLTFNEFTYSEAFAGSGEYAVVMLVHMIRSATERSLILLDEPEVSLHPGAQEQLIRFLEREILKKKHQVIFATHSPSLIRTLPAEAIKVFIPEPKSGKIALPSQSALPETAFFYIGEPVGGTKMIIVEDALAAEIVKRAMRLMDQSFTKLLDVKFFPGGSQTLWTYFVPAYAIEGRKDTLVLFDGDKRPVNIFVDSKTIPESENLTLSALIQTVTGSDIKFNPDGSKGNSDLTQKYDLQRKLIDWARANTDYLPGNEIPEGFLWRVRGGHVTSDPKKEFVELARSERGLLEDEIVDAKMILDTQIRVVAKLDFDTPEMKILAARLQFFAGDI